MKKIRIALDDGHGIETAGKRTPMFADGSCMKENEFNQEVCTILKQELKQKGLEVLLVAPETKDVPLTTRVQRANQAGVDLYISIHANAYGNSWNDANGIETWIYEKMEKNSFTEKLAIQIQKTLIYKTGRKDRGIKRSSDLYVLRATKMPAVLVECGFMTNLEEARLLQTVAYRDLCAKAICQGICRFFEIGDAQEKQKKSISFRKRYQTIEDVPLWGKAAIEKRIHWGGFAKPHQLNLSEDMVRMFVIHDRVEMFQKKKDNAEKMADTMD